MRLTPPVKAKEPKFLPGKERWLQAFFANANQIIFYRARIQHLLRLAHLALLAGNIPGSGLDNLCEVNDARLLIPCFGQR